MRNGHVSMVRKRYLLQAVIGSFFCSLATASASEPTLQETLDFLQRKSTTCSHDGPAPKEYRGGVARAAWEGTGTWSYIPMGITLQNDNTMVVAILKQFNGNGVPDDNPNYKYTTSWRSTEVKTVRLSDLSPKDTVVKKYLVSSLVVNVSCTKKGCININKKDISVRATQTPTRRMRDSKFSSARKIYASGTRIFGPESFSGHSYPDSGTYLFCTNDEKLAERIQKALTHAIKLSGGKDELF